MEEIAIYGVLWAIAIGFVVLFTRYLISLRKAREDNLIVAEVEKVEEAPRQELKLEVVKAASPGKPVKVAKKKTAAKKTAKKKAKPAPTADNL